MEGNGEHLEQMLRHSRAAKSEVGALFGEARAASEQWGQALDLSGRMERHPWLTLGAALGVGYLLGGGLFTRMTGGILRLGARLVLVPLVKAQLDALGQMRAPAAGFSGSEDGQGGL